MSWSQGFLVLVVSSIGVGALSTAIADEGRVLTIESLAQIDGKIELFVQLPEVSSNKLLFLLHGAGSDGIGQRELDKSWYQHWSDKGYVVAGVSMPGYGETSGVKDFCGPLTMQTLDYALEYLKNTLGVDHIGVIGHGQGAQAGLLLSAQRSDIRCVIASGGLVNLMSHKENANDPLMQTLVSKGYDIDVTSDEALSSRSPVYVVDQIQCPVLVFYREQHPIIYIEEVEEFVQAMEEKLKSCTLIVREKTPEADAQRIVYHEIIDTADSWVDLYMQ